MQKKKVSLIQKIIIICGKAGDKLPHPAILYCYVTAFFLLVAHFLNGTEFRIPGQEEVSRVTTCLLYTSNENRSEEDRTASAENLVIWRPA